MKKVFALVAAGGVAAAFYFASAGIAPVWAADAQTLVGKPAPNFTLDQLDGSKLTLSDLKGKKVVVLDFWATWCPPCRKATPILASVTSKYKDKGVAFYAIDEGETADTVRTYQQENALKFPVALDMDGNVGNLYGVSGIPQSVIIGKDGTVQAVHQGYSEDLESRLTAELSTLTAGKALAGTPPATTDPAETAASTPSGRPAPRTQNVGM